MENPATVEEYIYSFPAETQLLLQKIRDLIRKSAPDAKEVISYSMPAYKQNGIVLYFAALKEHVGFYAMPSAITHFSNELRHFKISKGTIQFRFDKPIPYDLMERIVKFRVKENLEKAERKNKSKKAINS